VKIYSEEGHGTMVKLYLPRVEDGAPALTEAGASAVPRGSETILVVEDDELVRTYVIAQLHSLGYATLVARAARKPWRWLTRVRRSTSCSPTSSCRAG
jgi:hypothetical protein